ncbi:MAG: hypothetical protein F6K36_10080 [Symploca sp. SIO3C6]|uniref:Uncharacterized protein n=1 Tax=Symploca sp. SIO1C4 TaxID=2607765 RepID=A0A6B3NLY6_9CYAN|nr:hypothetical protein [Symploca sp. SIO3C6]NER31442.1 hypothetical protein [Symploca sp. SIO1C4]
MGLAVNKTLLALVLALKDVEEVSEAEKSAFRDAADQLQLEPDNWEEHESDLLRVIQDNPKLNQLYRTAKSQLDALSREIPSSLLPTQTELEQVIPTNQTPVTRGFEPIIDDDESYEINNTVINILTTSNPPEIAKKLSLIEKLQQFLKGNREEN